MVKYIKQKIKMIVRLIKIRRLKSELSVTKEAIHEPGALMGYTCPRCGQKHCIYDFCLSCGQRLSYDYNPKSKYIKRFKDVDEMCKKFDDLALESEFYKEMKSQQFQITGEKYLSLKDKREKCKIELSDLINYDGSKTNDVNIL